MDPDWWVCLLVCLMCFLILWSSTRTWLGGSIWHFTRTKEVSGRAMASEPNTSNSRQPDYQSLKKVKSNKAGEHTYQNKVFWQTQTVFSLENMSLGCFSFSSGMGKTKTTLSHRTKKTISLAMSLIRFFSNEEKKPWCLPSPTSPLSKQS